MRRPTRSNVTRTVIMIVVVLSATLAAGSMLTAPAWAQDPGPTGVLMDWQTVIAVISGVMAVMGGQRFMPTKVDAESIRPLLASALEPVTTRLSSIEENSKLRSALLAVLDARLKGVEDSLGAMSEFDQRLTAIEGQLTLVEQRIDKHGLETALTPLIVSLTRLVDRMDNPTTPTSPAPPTS